MNRTFIAVGVLLSVVTGSAMANSAKIRRQGFGYKSGAGVRVDFDHDGSYDRSYGGVATGEYRFEFDETSSSALAAELLPDTFYAFCIDLDQYASSSWKTYQIVDLETAPQSNTGRPGSPMGTDKANDLRELFGRFALSVDSDARGQAFGAAVWEIVFENPATAYDLDGGSLKMTGMDTIGGENAHDIAETWLGALNGDTSKYDWNVFALSNNGYQDFGLTSPGYGGTPPSVIPEPATMVALAMAGAGVAGYLRRRRLAGS